MHFENQVKAMDTINRVSAWLGIPPVCLKNSSIKVDASIKPGEVIWYEAFHDGTRWKLTREIERTYWVEDYEPPEEEFFELGQSAIRWLIAQSEAEGGSREGES